MPYLFDFKSTPLEAIPRMNQYYPISSDTLFTGIISTKKKRQHSYESFPISKL